MLDSSIAGEPHSLCFGVKKPLARKRCFTKYWEVSGIEMHNMEILEFVHMCGLIMGKIVLMKIEKEFNVWLEF